MNKLKIKLIAAIALPIAGGCTHRDADFREQSDQNMRIQVTRMKQNAGGPAFSAYRLRLTPTETFRTIHRELGTAHFWYHMDSCFYLEAHGKKEYPLAVQPVAAGASQHYEYLLQFAPGERRDSVNLVYDDRTAGIKRFKFRLAF